MRKKAIQQGRSNARGRGVPLRYVEPLSDARTPLVDFFRILLGFVVTRLAARVWYGTEGKGPRSHQVLLVHVDGERWIVDVGFGGQGLREPLPFVAGEEGRQGPDWFRFITGERGEHVLQCRIEEAWANLYSFTLEPWLQVDYQFANYYHSHAPESPFVQRQICTMPTPQGRKTFTGKLFKVRGSDGTQELHVTSEGECK